jgi:hypothetical protein
MRLASALALYCGNVALMFGVDRSNNSPTLNRFILAHRIYCRVADGL